LAGTTFSAALTMNMVPPPGKYFTEWNTLADGSGASYAAGSAVEMPSNAIILYAVWADAVLTAVTSSGEWEDVSSEGFTMIISDTDHGDLIGVRVNGVSIASSNYEVTASFFSADAGDGSSGGTSDGTKIKIYSEYLKTLGAGTHNIDVIFKDNKVAAASLTIPATDTEIPVMLIAAAAAAVGGLGAVWFIFTRGKG